MNSILNQIKAADKVTPEEQLKQLAYLKSTNAFNERQLPLVDSKMNQLLGQITGKSVGGDQPTFSDPTGISDLQDQVNKLNSALQAGVTQPLNLGGKTITPSAAAINDLNKQITARAIESGAYFDPSDIQAITAFNKKAPEGTSFMLKGDSKTIYNTDRKFDPETFIAKRKREAQIAPASGGLFGGTPSFSEDNPHAKAAMASMATGGVAPNPKDMSGTPYTAANLEAVNRALADAQAELEASKGNDWSKLPGTASNLWYSTLGNPDVGLAKEYESAKQKVAALTAQKQDIEARLGNQK